MKNSKKLKLNKEQIAILSNQDLNKIGGGIFKNYTLTNSAKGKFSEGHDCDTDSCNCPTVSCPSGDCWTFICPSNGCKATDRQSGGQFTCNTNKIVF